MRRIGIALLLGLVPVACGSDGEEVAPEKQQDVRGAVARAQLQVGDLGGDWKLTATEPPGTEDTGDQALQKCVGKQLDVVEQTVVESETRTFERGADTSQQQVVSSSAAFDGPERVRRLFSVVGSRRFADCMATSFENRVRAQAGPEGGLSLDAGQPSVTRSAVSTADRSVHIAAPVKVRLDLLVLDGRFDVVLLSTGRVVSMLLGFSVGEPIHPLQVLHLTDLLLARQQG
jgi:hypothetical protein